MPGEPWTWTGPNPRSENAPGYSDWYTPPEPREGDKWLRPGWIELQNVEPREFDPDPNSDGFPKTLEDAIFAILFSLPEEDGNLLIPLPDFDDQTEELLRTHFSRELPLFENEGLPFLNSASPETSPAFDFTSEIARAGQIDRIIAVIDVDIGFANDRFRRDKDSTRFSWFWDMAATKFAPPPFLPGRFLSGADIDAYIALLNQPAYNEWDLYRDYIDASYVSPSDALLPSVYAHGSHVLDIAQGGPKAGANTALFGIQLPREPAAFNEGATLGAILDLAFLVAAAQRLLVWQAQGSKPEFQINVSVGGHSGRHDGASKGEQFMETLVEKRSFGRFIDAIYLPAGNSRETRTHRRFLSADIETTPGPVVWRILPDDGTPNFLEIWLEPPAPGPAPLEQPIQLKITTPSGLTTKDFDFADLPDGSVHELTDAAGAVIGKLYVDDIRGYVKLSPSGPLRRRVLIAITHTRPNADKTLTGAGGGAVEAAGDWKIEVMVRNQSADSQVGLWIGRDTEILRIGSGARQSLFPDVFLPGGAPQLVNEDGTISDIACGASTCVIGAHFASTQKMTEYSAKGIKQDPPTFQRYFIPTASAMAEDSKAHRGILAAGYFSGSSWRQGGTSVSAPLAMRYILGTGAGLSVKDALETKAHHDEIGKGNLPTSGPPELLFGYGRLDATVEDLGYPPRRRY